jgi:hypothetical protein
MARSVLCPRCGVARDIAYQPRPDTICRKCAASHASTMSAAAPRPGEMHRIMEKIERSAATGCWLWTASCRQNGYGQVYFRGTMTEAHRAVWTLHRGSVPIGMQLDHLCRVRSCVNPDHLEVVTGRENTYRSLAPSAMNKRKTQCVNGHAFDDTNTWISGGKRYCRECRRRRVREFQSRQAAS